MTNSIITPRNAIEIVLQRKTSSAKFKLYDTSKQRWLFVGSLSTLIPGSLIGVIANVINDQQLTLVAMLILLTSTIFAFAFHIAVAFPALATVKRLEASMGSELSEVFDDDLDLIGELARDYEPHHLRFAREGFCMMASQLRSRVSLLVGAIEKVGAIPLALVSYLAFSKAYGTGIFGIAESVYAALIGLYILGLRANIVAQWMDRVALIYGAALDMRIANNSLAK